MSRLICHKEPNQTKRSFLHQPASVVPATVPEYSLSVQRDVRCTEKAVLTSYVQQ